MISFKPIIIKHEGNGNSIMHTSVIESTIKLGKPTGYRVEWLDYSSSNKSLNNHLVKSSQDTSSIIIIIFDWTN